MDQFEAKDDAVTVELPVLPLRDVVVYPNMVIPLFVGREKSIHALELAMASDKQILLVAQKSASEDEPDSEALFSVGCVANVLQMLKLPDGTVKVLVEGDYRAQIRALSESEKCFHAQVTVLPVEDVSAAEAEV
jgi:ATP-dependent Lon protease